MNFEQYLLLINSVKEYNSYQEKDVLLSLMKNPEISIEKISEKLGLSYLIKDYNIKGNSLLPFMFKARQNTIGDEISAITTCTKCSHQRPFSIKIDDMFFKDPDNISMKYTENIIGFLNYDDIDEDLSFSEYDLFEEEIKNNSKFIFDNSVENVCPRCGNIDKDIIDYSSIISKFSLESIYNQYLDLLEFGHMNLLDINTIPSYEREIYSRLIEERNNKESS